MHFRQRFLSLPWLILAVMWTDASGIDLSRPDAAELELELLVKDWRTQWEKVPDATSARGLATSLQALGIIERQMGKPDEALPHLTQACELLNEHAPEMLGDAAEAKALTLQDLGQLDEAEELLRKVIVSRSKSDAGIKLAVSLDHLALNLLIQGRYPEVIPVLDQAEASAPKDQLDFLARITGHRGRLFHTLGSYAKAGEFFEKALKIPFKDQELRLSMRSQFALTQLRQGKTELAQKETEEVAEEARRIFANNPISAVPYINNLGAISQALGDLEIARVTYRQALEMLESTLGTEHPGLIGPLNNLGVAEQQLGDFESARTHLERAAELQTANLPPTHLRVAETERNLARNALLAGAPDANEHIIRATEIGLNLLDRLITSGSENERLNFIERFDLISLPCATGDPELIANVLIASKARLLDAMLAESKPTARPTWHEIQKSLPSDSAFVDTCRFTSIGSPPVQRYGAIVILPTGSPKWIPLGSDESLGNWLTSFHSRLRWRSATLAGDAGTPPALKTRTILRALEREFWEPLQLPSSIRHVAFSPDGRLHFLPLAALLDQENRPLSTRFLQITTVTSGRDLITNSPKRSLSGNPWTVLNVSDFPKCKTAPDGDPLLSILSSLEPMPGTRLEADKLRSIAPSGSSFLSDSKVRESVLRDLSPSPSVLHLGCHAFFLREPSSLANMPIDFDEHSELLFSGGLVLYNGANRKADSPRLADDDDLLFPPEIAKLPLRDTRLVTLSSCESGAGTPVSGEGLLGLRRAFSIAGAREVVVALWPVSDESTPGFMERFYQLALESDRPGQALWQAQGEFLTAAKSDDDYEIAVLRYAPFVLSQNSPLETGNAIAVAKIKSGRFWIAALAAIPLLLFVIGRALGRRKSFKV